MTHDPDGAARLSLPERPSVDKLRKDAKTLLRNYRDGDAGAMQIVAAFHPRPAEFSGLRDAQLTLARQHGYPDWRKLCDAAELKLLRSRSLQEQAELFAADACLRYNGDDRAFRYERAARMLEQERRLARVNLYSALAAGDLEAVKEKLEEDASRINVPGGPLHRPPLLYLTYSRVPAERDEVLAIMRLMLEKGADPDSYFKNDGGETHFSAMTGAMGEGERGPVSCTPHPYADELVAMLLDAGADPNEAQGLYNTQFTRSIDKWLPMLFRYGLNKDHKAWGDGTLRTLDYFVAQAAAEGKFDRVKLLVEHGADPSAVSRYNGHSCYSLALLIGHEAMAEWLAERGAQRRPLTLEDQFAIACRNKDKARLTELLDGHPNLAKNPALIRAAMHFGIELVLWLVDQGFDINGQTRDGRTLLMDCALANDLDAAKALIEHGANADLRDRTYGGTALGFALHNRSWQVIDYLMQTSNDILDVVRVPHVERARYLLEKDSTLAGSSTAIGNTPLHLVSQARDLDPDLDESARMIDLLLEHGADIEARNNEGLTPLQWYRKLGVDGMVELLQERGARLNQ